MCSQPSRRKTPSSTEHVDTLKKALVDVAQESYFSFAEYCQADRFKEAVETMPPADVSAGPPWLSARVAFHGAFAGQVTVVLPFALASDMAASIAGLMPGDPIEQDLILDATGEFANMVCGTWLTRAAVHRRFDLQPPAVAPVASAPGADGDEDELLLINDWPVKLTVMFDEAA